MPAADQHRRPVHRHERAQGREELADAAEALRRLGGSPEAEASFTLPDGSVRLLLSIRKTGPTPGRYPRRWAEIKNRPL